MTTAKWFSTTGCSRLVMLRHTKLVTIHRLCIVTSLSLCTSEGYTQLRCTVFSILGAAQTPPTKVDCNANIWAQKLITLSAAATVRPGLKSAASSTVAVPWTTSSLGDRSFAAAGPRAWNKLPPPLRHVYSAATFKRQLKTFLYNHAFNSHC